MNCPRLIEVSLPIKEISAESVRDKSIRHGHISTLHLWWARRPLPTCRAVVFASIVPDPADPACPQAFVDAVKALLGIGRKDVDAQLMKPYADIPYTPIFDPVDDTPRNRLTAFIGKFSDNCSKAMLEKRSTPSKEQLSDACLIKWESKNNPRIIDTAQELLYVAYNAEQDSSRSFAALDKAFKERKAAIKQAEETLYALPDRHLQTPEAKAAEEALARAIEAFQNEMPAVFDPFAGGGAIPLEAARLGCRASGNDLNPVAHIIERASAEFPQRYGKPIVYSRAEFLRLYGKEGLEQLEAGGADGNHSSDDCVSVPNRLAFDVEFYAKKILTGARERVGHLYPKDAQGREPIAFYWARTATCSNPSCRAQVPLLKQFYLANTESKHVWLRPHISGTDIAFTIEQGKYSEKDFPGWNKRGVLTCPCCGSVTDIDEVKRQSKAGGLPERLLAVITEGDNGKSYAAATEELQQKLTENVPEVERPQDPMPLKYIQAFPSCTWGYTQWGQLFSSRQLCALQAFIGEFAKVKAELGTSDYAKALITFLAVWIDRVAVVNTTFGRWGDNRETIVPIFSRQAIPMMFDYPESNPFSGSTGSAESMLEYVIRYLNSESYSSFPSRFFHASSGDKLQFARKSITATVTDPPYYDAIAYADCSDFFYVWLKRTLGDVFPQNFATPQTPKAEECTALKHHHHGDDDEAKAHFEHKLTQIFDAIEAQTSDMVAVMFAHQSTKAWTTLLNSILGARMNITGSWPMDTERDARVLALAGAALESSVTVACRPVERTGTGSYQKVKRAIETKVKAEVEKLYALGFRGADLLTACFGQAAGEFGNYAQVEKGDGTPVSLEEMLQLARECSRDALLSGISGDDLTKCYVGMLQFYGSKSFSHDDANQFVRTAFAELDIKEVVNERLIVKNDNNELYHLATAQEHVGASSVEGSHVDAPLIAQAHRAILVYNNDDTAELDKFVSTIAPDRESPLWRLLETLTTFDIAASDKTAAEALVRNAKTLRQRAETLRQRAEPYRPPTADTQMSINLD